MTYLQNQLLCISYVDHVVNHFSTVMGLALLWTIHLSPNIRLTSLNRSWNYFLRNTSNLLDPIFLLGKAHVQILLVEYNMHMDIFTFMYSDIIDQPLWTSVTLSFSRLACRLILSWLSSLHIRTVEWVPSTHSVVSCTALLYCWWKQTMPSYCKHNFETTQFNP